MALALCGTAAAQRPTQGDDDSAALVGEGRAALRAGALDRAARALDQAIALNPRRVEAYVLRAAVDAARARYGAGIALLRKAQALAPGDDDVLTALGSQLVLSGESAAGVPLLAQVVARHPERYDAAQLLGHHLYATGAWPEAITVLEAYFAHRPAELARDDARQRGELGDAYLRNGQPREALAAFRKVAGPPGLRIRLGIAWATAAIDCGQARGLLRALEPAAAAHPEIGLVDGQCALVLGDPAAALERGRAYLARVPGAAAGHALLGEAYAARGSWADARRALETARRLEPASRRWPVRLAAVARRAGDPRAALDALEALGAPASPTADPAWWHELGEALLAIGDAPAAIARLAPVVPELPRDAAIRVVLGAAQLAAGHAEAALTTLDDAEALAPAPRSQQLVVRALTTVAVGKLATDPAAAEPLLVRASRLDDRAASAPGPTSRLDDRAATEPGRASRLDDRAAIWRDLGIARLALDRPGDAITALDRAMQLDASPLVVMLAARARALAGHVAAARPLYERALAAAGGDAAEIAIDWAASELQPRAESTAAGSSAGGAAHADPALAGDPAIAIAALERVAAHVPPRLAARHAEALAAARHAAGLAALRAGNPGRAVELLRAAVAATPSRAARCDLALATVVAGEPAGPALAALAGQACPFPPPADAQAVPILAALGEAASPRRAGPALARLHALAGKTTGAAAPLLAAATRLVALAAAAEAYRGDHLAEARALLAVARAAPARLGADELALDQATLDLADGKLAPAIAALERLAPRLPDALITLGLAYERSGEPQQALDAWRRARKAGARFAPLADWIAAKERIYGAAP